jgi:hypothetical protein
MNIQSNPLMDYFNYQRQGQKWFCPFYSFLSVIINSQILSLSQISRCYPSHYLLSSFQNHSLPQSVKRVYILY